MIDFQRIIFFPKVLYILGERLGFINGIFPLGNMKSIKPNIQCLVFVGAS